MRWLRGLGFEDDCSQATSLDYLAAVELLMGRRATLIEALEEQVGDCSHTAAIARLRCLPRDRHALGGRALRRGGRLRALPAAGAAV